MASIRWWFRHSRRAPKQLRTVCFHAFVLRSRAPRRDEIIYVDPSKIGGHMTRGGRANLVAATGFHGGVAVGGDWDLRFVDYGSITEKRQVYQSCYDHWVIGVPWSETALFQSYARRIAAGQRCRFSSQDELIERYANLDAIFESVQRTHGLSTRREHLVHISIVRNGTLIWGPDGRHRICIALCLGLERMPARIAFVHTDAIDELQHWRAPRLPDVSSAPIEVIPPRGAEK